MENKSNIEIERDEDDFIMFKTTCDCSCNNHSIGVIVEKLDKKDTRPLVSLYFECGWREHYINFNIFQRFWQRIKAALKILFTGELYLDEEFIFRDINHLREFRNTLEEAILQIERNSDTSKETKV